jgi:hypothetical protein
MRSVASTRRTIRWRCSTSRSWCHRSRASRTTPNAREPSTGLRDSFDAAWKAQADFIRGQQAASLELLAGTLEKSGFTTPQDRQSAIAERAALLYRDGERKVRDELMSNATNEADKLGAAIAKSGRDCAAAVAWGVDHFLAPLAVRMTPTLDTVTRQSSLELAFERRPARDVLRSLMHIWESEAEGSMAIEIANEAAGSVFNARCAMTPGEIAKRIGVDLKLRAVVIDKDRDAAYEGASAIKRYREARMPKALRIARDEAMPLVMSAHEQLCGRHARYIPRGRTDYLDNSSAYTAPFASVLTEWLGRYLPASSFVLPGCSPRTASGAPFREGAGSR